MFAVLKTAKFDIIFSVVVGFAIMSLTIPMCKGEECFIKKAPSVNDMKKSTYMIGKNCYQFTPETVECPSEGAIESFSPMRN